MSATRLNLGVPTSSSELSPPRLIFWLKTNSGLLRSATLLKYLIICFLIEKWSLESWLCASASHKIKLPSVTLLTLMCMMDSSRMLTVTLPLLPLRWPWLSYLPTPILRFYYLPARKYCSWSFSGWLRELSGPPVSRFLEPWSYACSSGSIVCCFSEWISPGRRSFGLRRSIFAVVRLMTAIFSLRDGLLCYWIWAPWLPYSWGFWIWILFSSGCISYCLCMWIAAEIFVLFRCSFILSGLLRSTSMMVSLPPLLLPGESLWSFLRRSSLILPLRKIFDSSESEPTR